MAGGGLWSRVVVLFGSKAAPGVALLLSAVVALAWANSGLAPSYAALLDVPVAIEIGENGLRKPLILWINDGLMAIFFLLVGLEIKREVVGGHLSTLRKAALPVAAAVGGMAVPAALYLLVVGGDPAFAAGWGVPMATDIAFALGILALLGRRAHVALAVFLAAFAVADDIGAVLVIALFYTATVKTGWLLAAAAATAVLAGLSLGRVQRLAAYLVVGAALWLFVLKSGVHATIAGVVTALFIPHRAVTGASGSPLLHLEHGLTPIVTWAILPIFALANAGVALGGDVRLDHPVALGVAFGLVAGKAVGVTGASWLAVKAGVAQLPAGVNWGQIAGLGLLGGVGFTMAIFIASLAFADPALIDTAKAGILLGSAISGVAGLAVLRVASRDTGAEAAAA